ncbi:MAG: hypothetical protein KAS32_19940 [Candidatus Peribacteraceae bacterium]|nr:hypothetical protein [Candidatus Peribacteraceae bacterium]
MDSKDEKQTVDDRKRKQIIGGVSIGRFSEQLNELKRVSEILRDDTLGKDGTSMVFVKSGHGVSETLKGYLEMSMGVVSELHWDEVRELSLEKVEEDIGVIKSMLESLVE